MENAEIYQKLTSVFHEVLDEESIMVRPNLTADDVDEWDSLSHIRLVLAVQKAFQTRFSAAQTANLKNVGEFVALIRAGSARA